MIIPVNDNSYVPYKEGDMYLTRRVTREEEVVWAF